MPKFKNGTKDFWKTVPVGTLAWKNSKKYTATSSRTAMRQRWCILVLHFQLHFSFPISSFRLVFCTILGRVSFDSTYFLSTLNVCFNSKLMDQQTDFEHLFCHSLQNMCSERSMLMVMAQLIFGNFFVRCPSHLAVNSSKNWNGLSQCTTSTATDTFLDKKCWKSWR